MRYFSNVYQITTLLVACCLAPLVQAQEEPPPDILEDENSGYGFFQDDGGMTVYPSTIYLLIPEAEMVIVPSGVALQQLLDEYGGVMVGVDRVLVPDEDYGTLEVDIVYAQHFVDDGSEPELLADSMAIHGLGSVPMGWVTFAYAMEAVRVNRGRECTKVVDCTQGCTAMPAGFAPWKAFEIFGSYKKCKSGTGTCRERMSPANGCKVISYKKANCLGSSSVSKYNVFRCGG